MAIIVGQMIGTGIYMLPQGFAQLSNPKVSFLGLVITGLGTVFLAVSFARLGERSPVTGSAVAYTKEAFGDLPAFIVGWSYWCGCWIANGAIIVGGISYAGYFFPALANSSLSQIVLSVVVIWIYTAINYFGVKAAGNLNLILTLVKLVPLLLFMVIAAFHIDPQNYSTVSSPDVSGISTLPIAVAFALWSFIGFEGASVNAGEVKDAATVKKATLIGTIFVVLIYLILIILAAGNMPQDKLVASTSPFSDIIQQATGGYWAGGLISLGVVISAFGCIGAWILSGARVAYSLGEQGLFPKKFARTHPKYRTPDFALLLNGVLMSVVMFLSYFNTSISIYNFLVLLAVVSYLVFYAFGAASDLMLSIQFRRPLNIMDFIRKGTVSLIAFYYSVYTVFGSGAEYVMYGFLLILIGIPFFIYVKLKQMEYPINNKG
ncbi:MAG: amino acid permease-associated region [Bacillota bacterium]|jgi:amino acid transporter|nr:amino acid permease-associated region [Bacillota bacterium]